MSKIYNLINDISVERASIVSKRVFADDNLHMDIYAFDRGEELDREKLFGDSLAWVSEGEISLFYDEKELNLSSNECCLIEKEVWRKIIAKRATKLILITFKENVMIDHLDKATIFSIADAVEYQDGKVVSKTLVKNEKGTMTLMSFDGEQELSTHAAPGDALVIALDGEVKIRIADEEFDVKKGDSIVLPGKIPHALKIKEKYKMLLIVTRD